MKKIIFLLIVSYTFTYSQKEDLVWVFGNNCQLDFNFNPVRIFASPLPFRSDEGSASVSDNNGKLLFYTNGQTVYDRRGTPLPNGSGLLGSPSAASSIITKAPGCNTLYYVFTTGSHEENKFLYYSLIDLSLNNGFGDIVSMKKNIPLTSEFSSEKLDLCFHKNGKDYWLLAHNAVGDKFYSFQITSNGIMQAIISHIGYNFPTAFQSAGSMKVSSNGKYIGITYHDYDWAFSGTNVQILNFDSNSGKIGTIFFETRLPVFSVAYDLAFSPNERFVYITAFHAYIKSNATCYQYDLNEIDPALSVYRIDHTQDISTGIELGPDGRIYIAHVDRNYDPVNAISIIAHPNEKGSLCNFLPNEIKLVPGSGSLTNLCFSIKAIPCQSNPCEIILKQTCLSDGSVELLIEDVNGLKIIPSTRNHELFWSLKESARQANYSIIQKNPIIVPRGTLFSITSKVYSWEKGVPKTIEYAKICQKQITETALPDCNGVCNDFEFILSSCEDKYDIEHNLNFPTGACHSICKNDCKFIIALFEKNGTLIDPTKYSIKWSNGASSSYVEYMQPYFDQLTVEVKKGDCIWYGRYIRACNTTHNLSQNPGDRNNINNFILHFEPQEEIKWNKFYVVRNQISNQIQSFTSDLNDHEEPFDISIFNLSGVNISNYRIDGDNSIIELNNKLLTISGIYFIKIRQGNNFQILKYIHP